MAKASLIKNNYVTPHTKLDFSRSVFNYSRTHSTNILTGKIVPVAFVNCAPGTTVPNKFGFILQSAPLLGPTLDNVYIDIVSVWCPTRLVMADFNQWLGDNDTYAWTLGNNVSLPRITTVYCGSTQSGDIFSKTYLAGHYLAPHYGYRPDDNRILPNLYHSSSVFHNGIQVIPFRMYDLIWNRIFRNENIQNPILFSKQSGTNLTLDVSNYTVGLGQLRNACRMKDVYNTARISPSIETVDLGLNGTINLPVGIVPTNSVSNIGSDLIPSVPSGSNVVSGTFSPMRNSTAGGTVNQVPVIADLSRLTVNSMYYAIMLQKYMNIASNGRRPVEFYKNMFGISSSDAAFDDPELLSQKRFKVNVSRVIATSNSTDTQSNTQPLGTQGAFSLTTGGGVLFPEFTATEYGMLHVFAIIRTQESYSTGIDKYLADYDLLSTYLPQFDHIGEEAIEVAEVSNYSYPTQVQVFGYQRAWYRYRYQTNDSVGILSPGEPLEYMTLARAFSGSLVTIGSQFIEQRPFEFDRMLQFPVFYGTPGSTGFDLYGEEYNCKRYQWLLQFALAGDLVATMSKDSEPLLFGTRV